MYTFSASAFQIPHKIVGGGATGIGTVVYYLSGETIPVAITFLLVNVILLGIAIKILGPRFGVKTLYAIGMSSLLLGIMQPLFPVGLVSDVFMSTIIAGILSGVGVSLAITNGGSTGGTDILVLIISKYHNISPGKLIMYCDCIIIASSLLINFDIEGLMYGYVLMGAMAFTVDFVLSGQKQSAQLFLFTDRYKEVAARITESVSRGVTVVDCVGWYTGQAKKMLIIVVRKSEAIEVLKIAKRVDPDVFMTMNTVMGVFGQGFDEVKGVEVKRE